MKQKTILEYVEKGIGFLETHAVPDARESAEALLGFILEKSRWEVHLEGDQEIDFLAAFEFDELLKKRAQRYPLQYLLKRVPFREITLEVGEGCLIPRPETEVLVEKVLEHARQFSRKLTVLDIGTGSGNIAISLAKECPNIFVIATDISNKALHFAERNIQINGVMDCVRLVQTDLWQGLENIKFDMIVANPPYLAPAELAELQPEIVYEPKIALDGGHDGIDYFQRIVYRATGSLAAGGMIFFEVGVGQAEWVEFELKQNGFEDIRIDLDDAGIKRIISGVKR